MFGLSPKLATPSNASLAAPHTRTQNIKKKTKTTTYMIEREREREREEKKRKPHLCLYACMVIVLCLHAFMHGMKDICGCGEVPMMKGKVLKPPLVL